MISLSLSLIKLVVSLQSRSSRCGDVGSDRTQNSASELKSSASEDRPRRSRSFNLNIDSVELISSNSSSSLRRRNAHSNDDMNSLSISISHNHQKHRHFITLSIMQLAASLVNDFKCIVLHSKILLQKSQLLNYFFLI